MDTPLEQTWSQLLSSYTYSDIGLIPRNVSTTNSRSEVSVVTNFCRMHLKLPMIVAPMSTVVGLDFALGAYKAGIRTCLPRLTPDLYAAGYKITKDPYWAIPSVGINGNYNILIAEWYDRYGCQCICLDIANGYHTRVGETCEIIKQQFPNIQIITGNVASEEGYLWLHNMADAVRVGIGNGSVCTTSIATGVGLGQATAVRRVSNVRNEIFNPPYVIADGGIKNPGDFCKALALGADMVMVGSIFAGCVEAVSDTYSGEASAEVKHVTDFIEGTSFKVPTNMVIKSMNTIIKEYEQGLKSSMAYMGARYLNEFRHLEDDCFVKLSNASKHERSAHFLDT